MDFDCVSCTALPHKCKNRRKGSHHGSPSGGFMIGRKRKGLQDVIRNINIFRDVAELISHIALIDGDVLVLEVRRIEGEVFQDALQDRIEAAGADVFGLGIYTGGDGGDGGEDVLGEGDVLSCLHQEYTFFSLATVVFLALSYLTGSTLI